MSYEVTGSLFIVGVIISAILNLLVVVVLTKKGSSMTNVDCLMVSLAIADFLQAMIGYSLNIQALYGADTGDRACVTGGFVVTFFALTSISHLVGISLQRYVILKYPIRARMWIRSRRIAVYILIPAWLYGLMWSAFPLFGWNRYKRLVGDGKRCGIDLGSRNLTYMTYGYNLLVWCYFLPLFLLGYCCRYIQRTLKTMCIKSEDLGLPDVVIEYRKKLERKQSFMTLVLVGTFLLAWTPYALSVLILTIRGAVPQKLLVVSAYIAKSSTLYNPIIYSIFLKDFRQRCKRFFLCDHRNYNTNTIVMTTNGEGQIPNMDDLLKKEEEFPGYQQDGIPIGDRNGMHDDEQDIVQDGHL